MTSILTNHSAMAALQTLRAIGSSLTDTQQQVSTGLRVGQASDNVAYWSISTTMRSDNKALSAVSDALGLGAANVDVAYAGIENTIDLLGEFRAKLVSAQKTSIDKSKIQNELDQLKKQFTSIATSTSFNGVNWLDTGSPDDLMTLSSYPTSLVSSFIRSSDGTVRVGTTEVDLADISLFNVGGGGALQKDIRSLGDIGGFRSANLNANSFTGGQFFEMTGPVTLGSTDSISFNLMIDGSSSQTVTITRATIDTALGGTNGLISNIDDYTRVLNQSFVEAGISSLVGSSKTILTGPPNQAAIGIISRENTGASASTISVNGVNDTTGGNAGGLRETPLISSAGGYARDQFTFTAPFEVYHDVSFSFNVSVNKAPGTTVTVDRQLIDSTLGTADGKISSPADLANILNVAMSGVGLIATENSGRIVIDVDPAVHPEMGARSRLNISNVTDNLGPAADFDILDVDITNPANSLDNYLSGVDSMLKRVITGGATLGVLKTRIDMQQDFAGKLMDAIDQGVSRLVDTDMEEASARLSAQQTQQQLAVQSLQIANGNSDNLLRLFR
ncbi:flagellin [uncultured Agrobacterium sp.]|uniref:flagellin N-terminal helical domain-containing protein n=1 Tax=uncultured Agrobacterium sp. TaxID=157277 RepID=UPI0025D56D2B|nr:flagellin [uncultured Agrobacterium sp.]